MIIWQRNLVALFIAHTMGTMALMASLLFLPFYVQTLGVSGMTEAIQWTGLISGAMSITNGLSQPVWGHLSDRLGARSMLLRSTAGSALVFSLMGLATSPEQLLALGLAQGLVGGWVAASYAMIATSTPQHRLGFALGTVQVALFAGSSAGALLGGMLSDALGLRATFYAAAGLFALSTLIVIRFVQDGHSRVQATTPGGRIWAEGRSLLAIGLFPALIGVVFLVTFGGSIVNPLLSPYIAVMSATGNVATIAGIIVAATGVASGLAAFIVGQIADRVGHAKILLICLLGSALSFYPQATVDQVWHLAMLRVVGGIFAGGLMPAANALVGLLAPPDRRGVAFGLTAAGTSLAYGLGPLAGAAIMTLWGMRAVFLTTGVLFTVAFGWLGLELRGRRARVLYPEAE